MSDYTPGEMNIAEQTRTFSNFMKASVWGGGAIIVMLVALVLTFCTSLHWFPSMIAGAVVGVLVGMGLKMKAGWYAMVIAITVAGIVCAAFISFLMGLSAG